MKIKKVLKEIDLKKLKKTGFFSIFLSTVLSKVLVFFGGIIIVRILSKTDYGIYAYVLNVISILTLLSDFGASSAAIQFMTENTDDKQKQGMYLKYALKIGIISSIVSSILILLSPLYYPYTIKGAKELTIILAIVPILTIAFNFIPVILRSNLDNKRYGIMQISITFINYVILISMSLAFGLFGAIISQYIYNIIIIILGFFLVNKYLKKISFKKNISEREKKDFLGLSIASQINNTISQLLIIIDTFLVGLLIASPEAVASYKISSAIPHALAFLPTCVVIYILPYFIKNNKNKEWIQQKFKLLIKYGCLLYGTISIILIVFSKLIFYILYGNKYYDAIPIYIVLVIAFFFSSTIKIPCSNIAYSLRKVKINIYINIICIVVNLISNYFFITYFGSLGAAITTMIISITSSIIYLIYIHNIIKDKNVNEEKTKEIDKK